MEGEKKKFSSNIAIILMVIVLIVSLITMFQVWSMNKPDSVMSLHKKITAHADLKKYETQYPRISYISDQYLATEIGKVAFFRPAKHGDLLVEYNGGSVIYRPSDNTVVNLEEVKQLPSDFFTKFLANNGMDGFKSFQPNVIFISKNNIEDLQKTINGLDESYVGNYILNYNAYLVVYDYENNKVKSIIPMQQQNAGTPQDFMQKLLAHPEMKGYESQKPEGAQIDQQTLAQLMQASPETYKDAVIGDYIIRYPDKLIIYDYRNDVLKKVYNVQQ